jgi:hypothetical protein
MSLFDPPTPEELDDAYRQVPGLRRRARLRTRRRRGAALGAVTVIAAVVAVVAISSGSFPPRPVRWSAHPPRPGAVSRLLSFASRCRGPLSSPTVTRSAAS